MFRIPPPRRLILPLLAGVLLAGLLPSTAHAEEAESLADALQKGKAVVDLRLRYETVSDNASAKDAQATTLRTVLGYRSAVYKGFSLYAEAENVTTIGDDRYNNAGAGASNNGVRNRPVVADPADTEINQALVKFEDEDWKLALGRQEVVIGDARFVGNVGWRQNHQSFDAFRVDNSSNDKLAVTYAFLNRVHRIFGDSQDLAGHAIWAGFDLESVGKLTAYGLLLDYDDARALSTNTFGLELAGKRAFDDRSLLYEIEYAQQSDAGDNPGNVDAAYSFLMLGGAFPELTVKLGWEVLEGSPGEGAFRTPLATLHKFNGWADKFLATPANGLEDLYLAVNGKAGKIGWLVKYHDFSADTGSTSYGQELDLQLVYTAPSKITYGLKGAFYDADRFSVDTDKWMLWAAYKF